MNYLAIDASTEACSVALQYNQECISRYVVCPQSHSMQLLPMVDEVLKTAGVTLAQLDGLIFGQGPGSFTGVRIGVSVAQGLAFATDLPLVGVSTLQTMAQQALLEHQQHQVIAAIDARMSEIYTCYFERVPASDGQPELMQAKLAEKVLAPALLQTHLADFTQQAYGVGTGWDAYSSELQSLKVNQTSPDILFPHAQAMLPLGQAAFLRGEQVSAEAAQPVYVRDTVSWKKLPGRE